MMVAVTVANASLAASPPKREATHTYKAIPPFCSAGHYSVGVVTGTGTTVHTAWRQAAMKVLALISGGKDSCYSMVECHRHGHEVCNRHQNTRLHLYIQHKHQPTLPCPLERLVTFHVIALANLLPQQTDEDNAAVDELDSYMYQTVGHQAVAAYAECMQLPLYRRRIRGSSKCLDLVYRPTEGDEVEDLLALVRAVQRRHPELQAVCSGAIASDYQRTRVENVCSRLGLISLAFLWRRDQQELLDEMICSGLVAIVVKVAAMGLKAVHLGRTLNQLQPHLLRLWQEYGCHPCGEGGEFETLTIDCPLFYKQINLLEAKTLIQSDDSMCPVAHYRPLSFQLVSKASSDETQEEIITRAPLATDHPFSELVVDVNDEDSCASLHMTKGSADIAYTKGPPVSVARTSSCMHTSLVGCISDTEDGHDFVADASRTALELRCILESMELSMVILGLSWQDAVYVQLFLSDMAHFQAANKSYVEVINHINPPSRACVQVALPANRSCMVEVLLQNKVMMSSNFEVKSALIDEEATTNLPPTDTLHVQSISKWAPSCIGPYSQATTSVGLSHIAGQIGLDPARMELPHQNVMAELHNAIAHALAVSEVIQAPLSTCMVECTTFASTENAHLLCNVQPRMKEQYSEAAVKRCIYLYLVVPVLPKGSAVEIKPTAWNGRSLQQLAHCCQKRFELCRTRAGSAVGWEDDDSDEMSFDSISIGKRWEMRTVADNQKGIRCIANSCNSKLEGEARNALDCLTPGVSIGEIQASEELVRKLIEAAYSRRTLSHCLLQLLKELLQQQKQLLNLCRVAVRNAASRCTLYVATDPFRCLEHDNKRAAEIDNILCELCKSFDEAWAIVVGEANELPAPALTVVPVEKCGLDPLLDGFICLHILHGAFTFQDGN